MKIALKPGPVCALILALGSATAAGAAFARAPAASARLAVTDAWSRPVPAGLQTGVVYMTLINSTARPDRLIDASTPVATKMDLHRTTMVRGRMSMIPVPGGLVIPAGGRVDIAPNGYHFMLIGLTKGLSAGTNFPVTLRFAQAGVVKAKVKVLTAAPGMPPMTGMAMGR